MRHRPLFAAFSLLLAPSFAVAQSQVIAWGDNQYGQCNVPTQIGDQVYTKIVAGDRHTLAVRVDGTIDGWGDNLSPYNVLTVPPLPLGLAYVDLVAGPYFVFAKRSDGSLAGWGDSSNGVTPAPGYPQPLAFAHVAAGNGYGLAALTDGSFTGWGSNYYGQLTPPPQVAQKVAQGTPIAQVAGGNGHAFALFADGVVYGWGYNSIGQANAPLADPGTNYIRIAAGAVHNAFLQSDGQIKTWGYNFYGQCDVPPLPPGVTYVDVVCGDFHTLALRSDGQAVAFGDNARGQCNVPTLPLGYRFVQFDASQYHSVARIEGPCGPNVCPPGTPFCFGDGAFADHTTPCPCGNSGATGNGCASSTNPSGAHLDSTGWMNPDTVVLHGSGMPSSSLCVYVQMDGLGDGVNGDGVLCAGGNLVRLRQKSNVGGASEFPQVGDVSVSTRGHVTPGSGDRRYYHVYYRNAAATFCPPSTFNVTNGLIVDW